MVSTRCSKLIRSMRIGPWVYMLWQLEDLFSLSICITDPFSLLWKDSNSFPKILCLEYYLIFSMLPHTLHLRESLALNHMIVITKHFTCMAFYLKHLISNCVSCIAFNVDSKIFFTTSSDCHYISWGMNTAWSGLFNILHNQISKVCQS